MKPIKDPFITTVRNLKSTSASETYETLRRIEDKIVMYGLCSDREWAYYQRHTNGQINQKEVFTQA
jgi:hypothetical protein